MAVVKQSVLTFRRKDVQRWLADLSVKHANARAYPSPCSVSSSRPRVARLSRGKRRWSRLGNACLSISDRDNGPLTLLHVHGSRKGSEVPVG